MYFNKHGEHNGTLNNHNWSPYAAMIPESMIFSEIMEYFDVISLLIKQLAYRNISSIIQFGHCVNWFVKTFSSLQVSANEIYRRDIRPNLQDFFVPQQRFDE